MMMLMMVGGVCIQGLTDAQGRPTYAQVVRHLTPPLSATTTTAAAAAALFIHLWSFD